MFLGLRELRQREDQSQYLRAKTEFLQMALSIFLNDNSYSIIKSDIFKNSPKEEKFGELFLQLVPQG